MEILVLLIVLALYVLPGIIASSRGHHNQMPIWIINIFLGWSLLGWVGALAWACTKVDN